MRKSSSRTQNTSDLYLGGAHHERQSLFRAVLVFAKYSRAIFNWAWTFSILSKTTSSSLPLSKASVFGIFVVACSCFRFELKPQRFVAFRHPQRQVPVIFSIAFPSSRRAVVVTRCSISQPHTRTRRYVPNIIQVTAAVVAGSRCTYKLEWRASLRRR